MANQDSVLVYATQHMKNGGIESHLYQFCQQIGQAGTKIDLIILNAEMPAALENDYRSFCRDVFFCRIKRSQFRVIWLILVSLKLRFRKYNSLYTNGQGSSILLVAKLFGIKTWIHHHHTSGDKADQATWGSAYWKALREAKNVIACSFINARDMESVLHRSIDVVPCFSRKITVNRQVIKEDEKIHFGYYGRLIKEKGIDILCRLSEDEDCKMIQFHIWGEGKDYPPAFFSKFPRLQFHGTFKGLDGLKQVISKLDGFLLISTHPEGLPVCLLEAMGAGLPWMATDKGGIPDIACDPLSTRVIDSGLKYDDIKKQVLAFYNDLAAGKIDRQKQVNFYDEKFAAPQLVHQWKSVLRLNAA